MLPAQSQMLDTQRSGLYTNHMLVDSSSELQGDWIFFIASLQITSLCPRVTTTIIIVITVNNGSKGTSIVETVMKGCQRGMEAELLKTLPFYLIRIMRRSFEAVCSLLN